MVSASREPVSRALDVLVWIADHRSDPLVVRQIARDLDTTPSTVHRILGTFQQHGLIARGSKGEYVPGLELYRICASISEAKASFHTSFLPSRVLPLSSHSQS